MKKIYLFFLLLIWSFSVFSQNTITLSFSGKDFISHNAVVLDSVFLQNLTHNSDTTLYGSDSHLTVNAIWPVGINEITASGSRELILNQNYPNPFHGSTTVSIYMDYAGPMNLILSDGLGRKLAEYQGKFDKGFHSFSVSASGYGVLILTLSDNKNYKSIKIINAGQSLAADAIQYLGQMPYIVKSNLKSQESSGLIFFLGNQIQLTAYANGFFEKTIVDNPTKDTTYTVYMEPIGITQPAVTTSAVEYVTESYVRCGGNVTYDGGAEVTGRGVCWSTSPNPTPADNYFNNGTGTGEFVSYISGLTPNTLYHFRAFASNSTGTSYGEDITATTHFQIVSWYLPGDYVVASYPESVYQNWSPLYSPGIQNTDASSLNVEGYVYMANNSNQWKIATNPDWTGINYGPGAGGVLNPDIGSTNFYSPKGYYKININPSTLTYSFVATSWGVIGSATSQGWWDETALTYNPGLQTWRGGISMVPGLFCFRANHSWDYFYYSTTGNSSLSTNGTFISVDQNADYYVVLDLSHPNAYTFSANCWGVLGSATNNGWLSDQNLTWDTTNKVLSTIIPLTVGEIKFRANHGWVTYLGGDINALAYGGANIPITEAGEYQISLDLGKAIPSCTITKLVSFLPMVTTAAVSAIDQTSVTCGGNVTYDGGTILTKRGVCWSVLPSPTIDDSLIENGYGRGEFVSYISGLSPNTLYHFRAYAVNSSGASYGEDIVATTLYPACNWYIPGDYVVESYPGSDYGQWAPSASPMIKNTNASPLNVEGYVYMANTSNHLHSGRTGLPE